MWPRTLIQLVERSSERWPDKGYGFYRGPSLSYAALAEGARRVGGALHTLGVRPGDIVGVVLPTTPDFLTAFFGIHFAGATPATLAPPASMRHLDVFVERLGRIARDAQMRFLVLNADFAEVLPAGALPDVQLLVPEQLAALDGAAPGPTGPDALALVQYTSGSTSDPKGVALTHEQLLAGLRAIVSGISLDQHDTNGQWLPLHHDMGLIGMLAGTAAGVRHHLSPPSVFIKDPAAWLASFARTRSTIYAGPNFSYALMNASMTDEQLASLDLSAWRVAFNGAEPINAAEVTRFVDRFSAAGMSKSTLFPVYGLAEATLAATFPKLGEPPKIAWVDRTTLARDDRAVLVDAGAAHGQALVSVGRPVLGHEVSIMTDCGAIAPDGQVGEIALRGPAVMREYYRNAESTAKALRAGWLYTGDRGLVLDGDVYVVGRIKEMIIVRGHNVYPQDVEALVRPLQGVYRQRCVAFGLGEAAPERIAVLVETKLTDSEAREGLLRSARSRLATLGDDENFALHLVRPLTLLQTTSGKYRRLEMRRQLLAGDLEDKILRSTFDPLTHPRECSHA